MKLRSGHRLGPTVPAFFSRSDLIQPEMLFPVLGLVYITDDQPSLVWT